MLHSFSGGSDGVGGGAVTPDRRGNLYGASMGGGSLNCRLGCGVIWELTPPQSSEGWTFATLYDFTGGSDGAYPNGGLLLGPSGDLYGTTTWDGAHNYGTAFELSSGSNGWSLTTLHAFCSEPPPNCVDGGTSAGLVWGPGDEPYGTSPYGGTHEGGAIFKLVPGSGRWTYSVLHSFQSSSYGHSAPGGSDPYDGLVMDQSANLYGTTYDGGVGYGVVFELTLNAGHWQEHVLHRFTGFSDGAETSSGVTLDTAGNLYGTTLIGGGKNGCTGGCGTVYKVAPQHNGRWRETLIHTFGNGHNGAWPYGGVVMEKAGNLYGFALGPGGASCNVIYKLAPAPKGKWKYSIVHTFGEGHDGCTAVGNLTIDSSGNLYGGTMDGGAYGYGVAFEITP